MSIIQRISQDTGMSEAYILKLIRKAPYSYRNYNIPKKNGGVRHISHPSAELKVIQSWVLDNILASFPVHENVYSYKKSIGVASHAECHRKSNYLARLDLQNFFPSITSTDVRVLIARHRDKLPPWITADDFQMICRIVSRHDPDRGRLAITIGAPTSPAISNSILYDLDCLISEHCEDLGVVYTRYADDLYFSTSAPNVLCGVVDFVRRKIADSIFPRISVNEEKTVFTSRKRRMIVTGVTIASDRKLSIGRDAKRSIRTQVFLASQNKLDSEELECLRGKLNYYRSVEPGLIDSLVRKFGESIVLRILRG